MRYLLLAATATLALSGTAKADESVRAAKTVNPKGAHYRDANASADFTSAPDETLSAHDMYVKNLRDSGYDSRGDRDSYGNVTVAY